MSTIIYNVYRIFHKCYLVIYEFGSVYQNPTGILNCFQVSKASISWHHPELDAHSGSWSSEDLEGEPEANLSEMIPSITETSVGCPGVSLLVVVLVVLFSKCFTGPLLSHQYNPLLSILFFLRNCLPDMFGQVTVRLEDELMCYWAINKNPTVSFPLLNTQFLTSNRGSGMEAANKH